MRGGCEVYKVDKVNRVDRVDKGRCDCGDGWSMVGRGKGISLRDTVGIVTDGRKLFCDLVFTYNFHGSASPAPSCKALIISIINYVLAMKNDLHTSYSQD
jgi:hypothetical protein